MFFYVVLPLNMISCVEICVNESEKEINHHSKNRYPTGIHHIFLQTHLDNTYRCNVQFMDHHTCKIERVKLLMASFMLDAFDGVHYKINSLL